jgi:phage tail-like protein
MGRSQVKDPLQQFRFKVEVPGLDEAIGFTAVEGLESEIEVTNYREGGFKGTHKLPGIEQTGTVTFRRGAFKNNETYLLFRQSLDSVDFRKDITVIEQDRMGNNIRQWTLAESWASKFTGPSLDANSSEVSIEAIEVQTESIVVDTL